MTSARHILFDFILFGIGLMAVMMLMSCSSVPPVIKVCGVNQSFTQGEERAIAEQLSVYREGSPIRDLADDWQRMRSENRACTGADK